MKTYPAIAFRSRPEGASVVLFVASALDIASWSGVPQRELLDDGQETIGFQREENSARLNQLAAFFANDHNVAQNPLLCAQRSTDAVRFKPEEAGDGSALVLPGEIEIDEFDFGALGLSELFSLLKGSLEARQPSLSTAQIDPQRRIALLERLQDEIGEAALQDQELEPDSDAIQEDDGVSGLFTSETHVLEFWQEVAIRLDLLTKMTSADRERIDALDSFLGFDRDALVSYLKPVFLVDGQHRLRGAVLAAERKSASAMADSAGVLERLESGEPAEQIADEILLDQARLLPVSMLMDTNVEEHVFQFVVVNQKATPVGKALLGTIVATSLTQSELDNVSDRLEQVQINVSDSQAVAWFTRNHESAFYGLVQQGIEKEGNKKLMWSVLRDLVSIFRNLHGAKLYHSPRNDYADKWRRTQLLQSDAVAEAIQGVEEEEQLVAGMEAWQSLDGPWRDIANAFFLTVRDELGDPSPEAHNGWGQISNLFNKVSLNILVADFFQWLTDKGSTINDSEDCKRLVREWLAGVDRSYFNRNWSLSGVKRESTGIRSQWSELWNDYRKDPQRLPAVGNYRKPRQS